jgi:membrane-bound metal-dependent hydrolase YbcI (DUF457 family)
MSPATHFLAGWVLANAAVLNRRERIAVTVASIAPDIDGLGAIPEFLTRHSPHPLLWFSEYHHALHTLWFAAVVSVLAAVAATHRWKTAVLAFLVFHLHLLCDLVGSRGPDGYAWPIPYLQPFSDRWQWNWQGQWPLNSWENFAITIILLLVTLIIVRKCGRSPVETFSMRADRAVVAAIRSHSSRVGAPGGTDHL